MNPKANSADYGRYQLLRRIAVGGMAEVYLALERGMQGFERPLVIKKILPHLSTNEGFITMFLDEARIAAQLTHPNIVQIYDLGQAEGSYYLAMEYLAGKNLRQLMEGAVVKEGRVPWPFATQIALGVCSGLDYAHRKVDHMGRPLSIVHRDVSPQNILITYDGIIKLLDFGIAKATSRVYQTRSGALKGKASYMSPEQVIGHPLDGRSDLFSLGILLYEMLVGRRLFKGENEIKTFQRILEEPIPPPSSIQEDIPQALDRVVERLLKRKIVERYPDGRALQLALEGVLEERGVVPSSARLCVFMREIFGSAEAESLEDLRTLQASTESPSFSQDVLTGSRPPQLTTSYGSLVRPQGTRTIVSMAVVVVGLLVAAVFLWTASSQEERGPVVTAQRVVMAPQGMVLGGLDGGLRDGGGEAGLAEVGGEAGVAKEEPAGQAKLSVTASPQGTLYVDGRRAGSTPLTLAVKAGSHRLKLVNPTALVSYPFRVKVPQGQHVRKAIKLRKGTLKISALPWAEIAINGIKKGITPLPPLELYQGSYSLILTNKDLKARHKRAVRIQPGKTSLLEIDMRE